MNKSEFLKIFSKNMGTSVSSADKTLKIVFKTIGEVISQEDNLIFVGFGTFKTSISKPKKVRTPKGAIVSVPEKRVIKFSPGADLKNKANNQTI